VVEEVKQMNKSKRNQSESTSGEGEEEWIVEGIVGHRRQSDEETMEFATKFRGFKGFLWLETEQLGRCNAFHEYLERHMGKVGGDPEVVEAARQGGQRIDTRHGVHIISSRLFD